MIDISAIVASVDLADVVGRYVALKNDGHELKGCCPFHDERTPSFTVVPAKGFVHCFGCGAHHDAIGFVMRVTGATFIDACRQLGARDLTDAKPRSAIVSNESDAVPRDGVWIPIYPVPDDAPPIVAGQRIAIWNPKRKRYWNARPARADAYRDRQGRLMGYVLRIEFDDRKITPQITWCIGPDGDAHWCARPFPSPRPLCGLDALAAKPDAPVLMVEGEKCREAGARALPMYAVIAWPGGSKGIAFVDWSPLAGRDVVLWPDADQAGRDAMLGYTNYSGLLMPGVAQYAQRALCKSIRMVDPEGQVRGWDIADAIDQGWTARQLATWAASRVKDVEVTGDGARQPL